MKVGDIVKVRVKTPPYTSRLGIVVRAPRQMYMAGIILEVMIDGVIRHVKKEHTELIRRSDQ